MPRAGEEPEYLEEGNLHEEDVVQKLQASGSTVDGRQQRVVLEIGSGKIVGHLDAGEFDGRILEIKAPGKNVFKEVEAMGVEEWVKHHQQYSWQVSGGMWATGKKATVVVKSRDSGKVLRADIDIPPKSIEDFEKRMAEIDQWVDVDRFPPCEKSGWCWQGEYRHIHYKDTEPKAPIPIHETRNRAVEVLSEKLYDVRQKKKMYSGMEDTLKDELLSLTGEGVYLNEKTKTTIREIETTRMDQKQVRAEHGDKYDYKAKYVKIDVEPRE